MRLIAKVSLVAALAVTAVTQVPVVSGAGADPAAAPDVAASDTRGDGKRPCPPVDTSTPYVTGGCRSVANASDIELDVRTVFGALPFAYQCSVTFDLTIARDGRTWMDRILIGGGVGDPCNDVRPCEPDALTPSRADKTSKPAGSTGPHTSATDFTPWEGRLHPDGDRFVNRFQMCVDTCAGRYDGKLEFALVRRGRGWAIRADQAPVGTVGMVFNGEWQLDPGRFDLVAEN